MDRQIPEAPLSAGPPPLFDVTAFSQWVTDVFTEEYDDEILDKLASMDAGDDMAKMKLLLSEECAARRSRLDGVAVSKSYSAEDEGSASKDVLMICFGGENDCFGGNGATEGVTHTAFLKLCKKANVKYAIFVRDATHCWYQRGLKAGIDPNQGFDSVIDELGKEIDLIKPREVVCMGSSMGGYAAIRAGLVLKASAIIAFSPQVLLGTADRASAMILPMPTLDPYLLKVHLAAELDGFYVMTLVQCVEQCPGYDTPSSSSSSNSSRQRSSAWQLGKRTFGSKRFSSRRSRCSRRRSRSPCTPRPSLDQHPRPQHMHVQALQRAPPEATTRIRNGTAPLAPTRRPPRTRSAHSSRAAR